MGLLEKLRAAYREYDDAVRCSVVEVADDYQRPGNYDFERADIRDLLAETIEFVEKTK